MFLEQDPIPAPAAPNWPAPVGPSSREQRVAPGVTMAPTGQRDYSAARLTQHALDRFVERFGAEAETAEAALRVALARTRRLGRNPDNGAIAVLAVYQRRTLVAILQESACLTVLTWPQFLPRMHEFGRTHLPRKRGRMIRRLLEPED
jgi:hypothetical protein